MFIRTDNNNKARDWKRYVSLNTLRAALCITLVSPAKAFGTREGAPQPEGELRFVAAHNAEARIIRNEYIVFFGNGISGPSVGRKSPEELRKAEEAIEESEDAEEAVLRAGGAVNYRYRFALIGFSATVTAAMWARLYGHLYVTPGVIVNERQLDIEYNHEVVIPLPDPEDVGPPEGAPAGPTPLLAPVGDPASVRSGLDRIDGRLLPTDGSFTANGDGDGVRVYVIDSGIYAEHVDFGDRVRSREGFAGLGEANGTSDCNGHGSHVAGIIGGTRSGVAKKVSLIPVRIFPCSLRAPVDRVIAAVDWVTADYVTANDTFPAVANMSMQDGQAGRAFDLAVGNSVDAGITYVVAAGNGPSDTNGSNSCAFAPARVPNAITVGSIRTSSDNNFDVKVLTSNFGKCVDISAPGYNILSVGIDSNDDYEPMTGTSMAAPHVAGVAALYLQSHPEADPGKVWRAICGAANVVPNSYGWPGVQGLPAWTENRILYWGSNSGSMQC